MSDKQNWLNSDEKKQFLEDVKSAAKEGAKQGSKGAGAFSMNLLGIIRILPIVLLVVLIIGGAITISNFSGRFDSIKEELTSFEAQAESHDLVVENDGILGYTAADFEKAILGDQMSTSKLEVMRQEMSDVVTITDTGFANWSALTKTQLITYHGTAIYTVDLSELSSSDIEFNEDEKTITVRIPHVQLEPINIQSSDIEFGDVSKGLLAFGDIEVTPEQMAEIQTMAQDKMVEKINEQKISDKADDFAKMNVWKNYQPVINSVAKGYSLVVEFK